MNKILFVTHDTSRSGAPLLLLNYIKWLKEVKELTPLILIARSGELDGEFRKQGKVFYAYQLKNSIGKSIFYKIYTRLFNSSISKDVYYLILKWRLKKLRIGLIYSNTICNGNLMEFLNFLKVKQVCHVHEGPQSIETSGVDNLNLVKKNAAAYIACSDFVLKSMVTRFRIPSETIELVYSSVNKTLAKHDRNKFNRNFIGHSEKPFLLGGSGGMGHWKGTDLIIPLVKSLLRLTSDFHFTWVGGNYTSDYFINLKREITSSGLNHFITLIPSVVNPLDYYVNFDLFVLLSREDSFPLVCLENALLGNSIVCFEYAGGTPELLADYMENILPFLNVEKMATRILFLIDNPKENASIGQNLKARVLENYTSDICFPKMYEVMHRNLIAHTK